MPVNQPIPGVVRITVPAIITGQRIANVFHYRRTSGNVDAFAPSDLVATREDFEDNWKTHVMPLLVTALVLQPIIVQDLFSDEGQSHEGGTTQAGSVGQKPFPINAAMCVSWHQEQRYRGGHARTYLCGLPEVNNLDGRHFSPDAVTAFTTAMTTFFTTGLTGLEQVLVRRISNKLVLSPPRVNLITGLVINSRIDSQRRRLGKA